jgi:hypothetical protein
MADPNIVDNNNNSQGDNLVTCHGCNMKTNQYVSKFCICHECHHTGLFQFHYGCYDQKVKQMLIHDVKL